MTSSTDTLIAFDTTEHCKQPRKPSTGAFGSYRNSPWGRRPSREIKRVENPKHIPTIQARFERAGQPYTGFAPTPPE